MPWWGDADFATAIVQTSYISSEGFSLGNKPIYAAYGVEEPFPGGIYVQANSQYESSALRPISSPMYYAATPVPEINGNTIPLLAFILGVIGLGLRGRSSFTTSATPA